MLVVVELLDVEGVALAVSLPYIEFQDGPFVIIYVAVVRRREHCDYRRELALPVPVVHLVPFQLCLMRPQHREQPVLLKKATDCLCPVEEGAPSHFVCLEEHLLEAIFIRIGVRP